MFTIEQSGHITKTNTIDGLINEYIKRYVDNYVIKGDVSNGGISNGNGITEEQLNAAVNGLRDYVINNYALSTDIPDEESLTTKINEALKGYALTTDIPTIPTDLINEMTLNDTLKGYALTTDIPEPVDLTPYYTSAQTDEKFVDEDELAYEFNKYDTRAVSEGKYALKTDIPTIPTDLVNETTLSETLKDYALTSDIPTDLVNESTLSETLKGYALTTDIPTIPTDLVNDTALNTALEPYAKTENLPKPIDLTNYALKTDIPEYADLTNYVSKNGDATFQFFFKISS